MTQADSVKVLTLIWGNGTLSRVYVIVLSFSVSPSLLVCLSISFFSYVSICSVLFFLCLFCLSLFFLMSRITSIYSIFFVLLFSLSFASLFSLLSRFASRCPVCVLLFPRLFAYLSSLLCVDTCPFVCRLSVSW